MQNTLIRLITSAVSKELEWAGFLSDYAVMAGRMKTPGSFSVEGMTIHTNVGIYQPGPGSSTQFIAEHLPELLPAPGSTMLEVGCGSGVLAFLGTRAGLRVDACDINPLAVSCTNENAKRNGISLTAKQSDLFHAYEGRTYDFILFNLPFYHSPGPISELERPLADPKGELLTRFLDRAADYLSEGGKIAFTFANCGNLDVLRRSDWDMEVAGLDYHQRNNFIRLIISARPSRVRDLANAARDYAQARVGERF